MKFWTQPNQARGIVALVPLTQLMMVAEDFGYSYHMREQMAEWSFFFKSLRREMALRKVEALNLQPAETRKFSVHALQAHALSEEFILLSKHSSLTRLLRATAYTLQFIYNCKYQRTGHQICPFLVKELECARKFWIVTAEMEYFPLEIARETNTSQIRVDWNLFPLSFCSCLWLNSKKGSYSIFKSTSYCVIT